MKYLGQDCKREVNVLPFRCIEDFKYIREYNTARENMFFEINVNLAMTIFNSFKLKDPFISWNG